MTIIHSCFHFAWDYWSTQRRVDETELGKWQRSGMHVYIFGRRQYIYMVVQMWTIKRKQSCGHACMYVYTCVCVVLNKNSLSLKLLREHMQACKVGLSSGKGSKISKPLWKGSILQWWSCSKKWCVCVREREGAVRAHTAGERERRRREGRHSKALLDASCMPYGEVATS
jgi:hypothetical protein